jgi:hypothetical protein
MFTWKTALQALVLLAIVGVALIIVSGFWHFLALIVVAGALLWLWQYWPTLRK